MGTSSIARSSPRQGERFCCFCRHDAVTFTATDGGGSAECTHDSPESVPHSLPSNMLDISFVVVHIASDLRGMLSSAKERSHSRLLCRKSTARIHHMVLSQDVTSSWLSQEKK